MRRTPMAVVPAAAILALQLTTGCGSRGDKLQLRPVVPPEARQIVQGARSFDDIFERTRELQLSSDTAGVLGTCSQVLLSRGSLLAVDSRVSKRVAVFDAGSGRFLRSIGSVGGGPGQYSEPTWVAVDSSGRVLVLDGQSGRLHRYTIQGVALGTIDLAREGLFATRVEVGPQNQYYLMLNHPSLSRGTHGRLVAVIDSSGNLVRSLGPSAIKSSKFFYTGGGLSISGGGLVFVVQPFDLSLQVWSVSGEPVSVVRDHLEKLPSPFRPELLHSAQSTPALLKLLQKHLTVNGLFILRSGLVVLTSSSGSRYCMSFFDAGSLEVLNGGICVTAQNSGSLTSPVLGVCGDSVFLVEEPAGPQLRSRAPVRNIKVVIFRLRGSTG